MAPGSEPTAVGMSEKQTDVESQNKHPEVEVTQHDPQDPTPDTTSPSPNSDDRGLSDNTNVPKMSYPRLFWFFFYNFGLFAWGGPVAQIALIKDKLVVQDQWITLARFQRVFAVYQILPGPEAAELCMFFGCLSAGRVGGIVAGVAFALPGFVLMLLASYLYSLAGFENRYFNASFRALQPIVAAMILRATHKIADHSVRKHNSSKIDPFLVIAAVCTAINMALRINIFISLGLYGVLYTLTTRRLFLPAALLFTTQHIGYALYVVYKGIPSPVSLALGIAKTPSLINLFILGLVAGSLSFGGAYTAIPFVQVEAVLMGAWLPQRVFLDAIAVGNILPAPLVFLASFFDGLCGSVIGVIAVIAMQILKASVEGSLDRFKEKSVGEAIAATAQVGPAAVLYILALVVLYKFTNKYTTLLLVIVGAVAGQFLFVD
ncbi:chromate transporter [Podospora appendiculata]|uniref:Chromate transporter n=1 Tax=Podospora appendiculata TaxID=314037 RepID=A0AAE0WZL7_9PEZI|nr:chromate transporter [Podospora appendiculata]